MDPTPLTHYWNVDFDLSWRQRDTPLRPSRVARVGELSRLGLLGTAPGDAALVQGPVPQAYLEHLDRSGLPVPRVLVHPGIDPGTRLRPFGWNREAARRNAEHREPAPHPDPDVVGAVNSRAFLHRQAVAHDDPEAGRLLHTPEDAARWLQDATGETWVAKRAHGNSGLGNRRLSPPLSPADEAFLRRALRDREPLLVERWRPRLRDWCTVFHVPWRSDAARVHETEQGAGGALAGAWFEPGGPDAPRDELLRAAEETAGALERAGYTGPACLDSFTWRDGDTARLRTRVDLNARRAVSDPAHRLWRDHAPTSVARFVFLGPGAEASTPDVVAALGGDAWRAGRSRGALLAAPVEPVRRGVPARTVLLLFGAGRDEVRELEAGVRRRLGVGT